MFDVEEVITLVTSHLGSPPINVLASGLETIHSAGGKFTLD